MNTKTILLAVDFSDVTARCADAALTLACAFQSRVVLLHIEEPEPEFVGFDAGPQPVRVPLVREVRPCREQLDALSAQLAAAGPKIDAVHQQGAAAAAIVSQAREIAADLIVIGSHGHGALYNLLVGSVTNAVLKNAPCPVLVVPTQALTPPL